MKKYTINHNSSVPLHSQVEEILRELIQKPEYRNGKLLPKEEDLAKRWGISRNTVRQAANKLVIEGHLIRKKGVGTKVIKKSVNTKLDSWTSFTHEMNEKGIPFKTWEINCEWVKPSKEIAEILEIKSNKKILKMTRLRGIGQGPVVFFVSYFHPRIGLSGEEDFNRPLYEMLEEDYHTVVALSKEKISVKKSEKWLASKLKLRTGSPILFRERLVYDPGERPVEYNVGFYNPDNFTYSIEIRRTQT